MYDVIDAISASTSLLFIAPLVIFFLYRSHTLLVISLGSFTASLVAEAIKRYVTAGYPHFKRPQGARACDTLCLAGSAENESGMPSGHASSTAFVATYLLLTNRSDAIRGAAVLYWLAVCYSRFAKRCHTIGQLAAGTILGATLAYLATKVSPY